jgi:nonsense-mediated mRNA decay protein 3
MLVKKTYPNRRKKNKTRAWKLRSIAKEAEDVADGTVGRGALGRKGGVDQRNVERDYELFLRDLEEDKEMRAAINLYKAEQKEAADGDAEMATGQSGSGLQGGKRRQGAVKQAAQDMDIEEDGEVDETEGADEGTEADEDDFPEIDMDELLEHFEEMAVVEHEPQEGVEEE